MSATSLKVIRESGLGLNFKVLTPSDGHRQDNTLWFGECDTCGERVTNSLHDQFWAHRAQLSENSSMVIDYCPLGEIVVD
jgi:hypothetical protein